MPSIYILESYFESTLSWVKTLLLNGLYEFDNFPQMQPWTKIMETDLQCHLLVFHF